MCMSGYPTPQSVALNQRPASNNRSVAVATRSWTTVTAFPVPDRPSVTLGELKGESVKVSNRENQERRGVS